MIQRYVLLLSLSLPTILLAQPANDLCSSITPEPLAMGSTLTFSGTRVGATSTNDGVAGSALITTAGVRTVWHAFTTTSCSDVTALYCNTPLPAQTTWNFLTPDCPGDLQITYSYANFGILCPNGQFGIQWVNLPAGTYYMPIYGTATSGTYEIAISAVACTPGPANDDCSGATQLTVGITCAPVAGSVEHGTTSIQTNACNGSLGNANDDVWFAFTATGTQHTITLDGNGDLDAVIELYDGNCGNTTPMSCADATLDGGVETIVANDLLPGNTYHVRVFHWYTALAYDPTFTICVTGDVGTAVSENKAPLVQVLPNPAHDRITISHTGNSDVRIMDLTGRTIWSGRSAQRTVIDVSTWPRGTYLMQVDDLGNTSTERIVLQ